MELVSLGVIIGTFGKAGELKVKVLTNDLGILDQVPEILIELDQKLIPIEIERKRFHKGLLILKLKNCNSITDGFQFKGGYISIRKQDRPPLSEDEFYVDQLIGLTVVTESGEEIGIIEEVHSLTANDVYAVRSKDSGKEYLIPAIKEIVLRIDLENRTMVIYKMKGLLNDED